MDVDIVNPYFRSSDHTDFLETRMCIVAPCEPAQSMLDTPDASDTHPLIIDMGGDDEGPRPWDAAPSTGDSHDALCDKRAPRRIT